MEIVSTWEICRCGAIFGPKGPEPRRCWCGEDKIGMTRHVDTKSGVPMHMFICDECEERRKRR